MGREVRRVPKDWEHPRGPDGAHKPMFYEDFATAAAEWKRGYEEWETEPQSNCEYWEWHGDPPARENHGPAWTDAERTHYQMYENTSEGTPISPVMETPEELAHWLADNGASAFARLTATYGQWLGMIRGGRSCSAVMQRGVMRSGVEAMADVAHEKVTSNRKTASPSDE